MSLFEVICAIVLLFCQINIVVAKDTYHDLEEINPKDVVYKQIANVAFINDMHLDERYTEKFQELEEKVLKTNFKRMRLALLKLSTKNRRAIQFFVFHVYNQTQIINELYLRNDPDKDAKIEKMIVETELLMKYYFTGIRSWTQLIDAMNFVRKYVITNNYKKTSHMAYHMCNLARVITVNNKLKCHMDMGMYGKDSPKKLIHEVLGHLKKQRPKIDCIVINGDFSAHGTSLKTKYGEPTEEQIQSVWSTMKSQNTVTLNYMRSQFPDVVILPSIGNNDVAVHNRVPCQNTAFNKQFYKELFDIWFPKDKISPTIDYDSIKESFLEGGYYAHEFPNSNITFIALNTLMFIKDNTCNKEGAEQQLEWVENIFATYEKTMKARKVIFAMHEFNGMNYFNGHFQSFWDETYHRPFRDIVFDYHHHMVFISSAHIHRMEMRSHITEEHPKVNITQLVHSATSPIYTNNPGYSTLEVWQSNEPKQRVEFKNFRQHNFQLQYYTFTGQAESSWRTEDPLKDYGLDLNKATTLRQYDTMFKSQGEFGAFLSFEFGFDRYFREVIGRHIIMPFFTHAYDKEFMARDLCAMMWFKNSTKFMQCYDKNKI